MSKSNSKTSQETSLIDDIIAEMSQMELWDFVDPSDQAFWEEFFQIEDLLEVSDELDPPSFSISVENHKTGEVKTYSNIRLKSARKKVEC